MQLGLLLLATEVLRPAALLSHHSPRVLLEAPLGVVFVVPVVEPVVEAVHSVPATTLADLLVIAMFGQLKLPRKLHRSTMTRPSNLLMISLWQN